MYNLKISICIVDSYFKVPSTSSNPTEDCDVNNTSSLHKTNHTKIDSSTVFRTRDTIFYDKERVVGDVLPALEKLNIFHRNESKDKKGSL